ncbi:MAG: hypothetical protein J6A63_06030 [Clostridia bacterium]|nr:hypothetical protein [Clostridia bacterium]
MQTTIKALMQKVQSVKKGKQNALASNAYFLNADEIVCFPRRFGDARYPYSNDGFTLWAFASGNVKIEESLFNIILPYTGGKEPNLCFYVGVKQGDGYFPVSVTGAGKLPFEKNVSRYTVYSPDAAYYFAETPEFVACVRMFVDADKNARFTLYVENKTDKALECYLSSYFNCMISHGIVENIETKWYRSSESLPDGYKIHYTEYMDRTTCLNHYCHIVRDCKATVYSTTSRTDYCGGMENQICCSTSLQEGKFQENKGYTEFTDLAIAGDIIPLTIDANANYTVSYTLSVSDDEENARRRAYKNPTTAEMDAMLAKPKAKDDVGQQIPQMQFTGKWKDVDPNVLDYFLKNVFRQAEFCARAKNYAGPFIGVRDIFQQLEAAQMWIPKYCRKKIVEALNFIGQDGRAPRQYSYPPAENVLPKMDLRPYVDQGVWVISTVYHYLAYSGDFSVLDEVCGYYKFNGNAIDFSTDRDTVLDHLIRITDFLVRNLDEETGCLHALYGDWNDALDGLGKTEDKDKEYGTGVSVMATLQLYRNLCEMSEILTRLNKKEQAESYTLIANRVKAGLQKYAIVENEKGERKILHGWGDKRSYNVASFCDNDGENRDGLTSNAFWIIDRAIDWDDSLKADILAAYNRLDSKYGIKTFEPYFPLENDKVGRITRLPKGTAENGAVYIHATLFAIWSLFEVGEAELAWEQLYKILPITHSMISTTPFVMPNSYVENAEKGFDGESMSDWFTGSGCVLVKMLIWYVFGVRADLDGVTVSPCSYLPFERMQTTLNVKGANVTIEYKKTGVSERTFFVDGVEMQSVYNGKTAAKELRFTQDEWKDGMHVVIVE